MRRKTLFVITVCAMALTVSACGGDSEKNSSKDSAKQERLEDKVEVSKIEVTSYEDIEQIYQFDLEGVHYKLPCTIDEFIQNGCTISESYLQEIVEAQHSVGLIKMHPDGEEDKYVYIEVLNDTDEDMTLQECQKVIGITVEEDSEVSFVLNSGLKFSYDETFFESLKKTYSTDDTIYKEDENGARWCFYHALPKEDDSLVMYSMLQQGTDCMELDNSSFELQYIPLG